MCIYINNSTLGFEKRPAQVEQKINVAFHDTGLFRCNETVVNTRFSRPDTMTLRINFY